MEKITYEVDPQNRLIIKKAKKGAGFLRLRRVLDGRFKTDKNNNLSYQVKSPIPEDYPAGHEIKLSGKWSLDKNHDLFFVLDKARNQFSSDQLTLKGQILKAERNALAFAMTTRNSAGLSSLSVLTLHGQWEADGNNRISFRVKKERGEEDVLLFDGAWQIGKDYQVSYRYEKTGLKRRTKKVHTLSFEGCWDIRDRTRISYVIDKPSGSGFNFRASAVVFKGGHIKYEIGVKTYGRVRTVKRILTLFGTWKVKPGVGLIFEVECAKRKVYNIVLGAQAMITPKDTVLFKLRDASSRKMSAELELSHRMLGSNGQAFVRLLKSKPESSVFLGAGWSW